MTPNMTRALSIVANESSDPDARAEAQRQLDEHNARTTSDLAGLAAREAGYAALAVDRVAEIRGRLEARTPGLWANAGYPLKGIDGPEVIAEGDVLIATMANQPRDNADADLIAHAPDDIRYLLNELAETTAKLDVVRQSHAACAAQRDAALTALAESEAEINRGRPGYSWIGDEALAALTAIQQQADALKIERDSLAADLARAARILAVEQGREGPEGWVYNFGQGRWVGGTNVETAYVERMPWVRAEECDFIAWSWEVLRGDSRTEGTADTALGAIEEAERALKGP